MLPCRHLSDTFPLYAICYLSKMMRFCNYLRAFWQAAGYFLGEAFLSAASLFSAAFLVVMAASCASFVTACLGCALGGLPRRFGVGCFLSLALVSMILRFLVGCVVSSGLSF